MRDYQTETAMNVADLIQVLLELDQQVISPRPSSWGKAAELVARLAGCSEGRLANALFGDWRDIDLSQVRQRAPRELRQPTLDRITAESSDERLRAHLKGIINHFYEFSDVPGCSGLSERIDAADSYLKRLETPAPVGQEDVIPGPPSPPRPKCGRCGHRYEDHERRGLRCTAELCECQSYVFPEVG
jgi:hypothetical protein